MTTKNSVTASTQTQTYSKNGQPAYATLSPKSFHLMTAPLMRQMIHGTSKDKRGHKIILGSTLQAPRGARRTDPRNTTLASASTQAPRGARGTYSPLLCLYHHFLILSMVIQICAHYYTQLILATANDIESNPGPTNETANLSGSHSPSSHPDACKCCHSIVDWSSLALQCDGCNLWSHKLCLNMSDTEYHRQEANSSIWLCNNCGFQNIHTSIFNSDLHNSSRNSSITFDLTSSPGAPIHCSSPTRPSNKAPKQTHLRIINVNCQSLWAKRLEFNHMIDSVNPDIVIGTESWLNDTIANNTVFPTDHYNVYRRDRGSRGGGVFILVKNTLQSTREEELDTSCEILWCKISTTNGKNIYVGAYYRPHENDEESLEHLDTSLKRLQNTSSHIVLGGDFNTPGWDWTNARPKEACRSPAIYEKLIGTLDDMGLQQMVDIPTRGQNILDLICTNAPGRMHFIDTLPGISDHHITSCQLNITPLRRQQKPRWIRKYGKADWAKISSELETYKEHISNEAKKCNINSLWTKFKDKLISLLDKYIPKKKTTPIKKLPYITPEIEKLIRRRDRTYKKIKQNRNAFDRSTPTQIERENKLRNLRREIQRKMRQAYWKHIDSIISPEENEENKFKGMKKFWQFIKANKKDQQGVATLKTTGKISTTPQDKANALNEQFRSVFNSQQQPPDNLLGPSTHPIAPDINITTQGITKLLQKLKPHKAAGPDDIPSRVLKELAPAIAPILQIIFQTSYTLGETPHDWKQANVVPAYKKGATHDPANYRPISLTCICCKIMEHIIASNIMQHGRSNNIIYENQHGFLNRRSCETQLLEFQNDILRNLERNEQSDVLIMDFSKAFDKVSHPHLIRKLEFYGITGKTLKWITDFLSGRNQCVVVEGEKSGQLAVTSGVPQGSVLGPSLFLYYINDIAHNLQSTVRLFADDTIAYLTIKNLQDAARLQEDINKLEAWENKWLMEFHPQKCQVLSITKNRQVIEHPYTLHGHQLEHTKLSKYLGVTISGDFRWSDHIDNITSKASKSLGFLKRNIRISSTVIKERAYKGIVRPLLEYSPCIWDPSTKKDINKIEMVQRRAARYVMNRYHNTSSVSSMLKELKWPSLQERRQHARLTMMYKIVNNKVDCPGTLNRLHPSLRSTRHNNSKSFQIPETSKNYIKESFIPRTIREWNHLPEEIVTAESIDTFKARLNNIHKL